MIRLFYRYVPRDGNIECPDNVFGQSQIALRIDVFVKLQKISLRQKTLTGEIIVVRYCLLCKQIGGGFVSGVLEGSNPIIEKQEIARRIVYCEITGHHR